MLVARIGDPALGHFAGLERGFELDAEPFTKLNMICKGAPDPLDRRIQVYAFFDTIRHKRNLLVALIMPHQSKSATRKLRFIRQWPAR